MNHAIREFSEGFKDSFVLAAALVIALVTTFTSFAMLRQPPSGKRLAAIPPAPEDFCRREDRS